MPGVHGVTQKNGPHMCNGRSFVCFSFHSVVVASV